MLSVLKFPANFDCLKFIIVHFWHQLKLMQYALVLSLLLSFTYAHGQNRSNIWYFGEHAGIDFNAKNPTSIKDGKTNCWEGTSVICDSGGRIVLYSDGITVWNGKHDTITNGNGLLGHISSNQSCLIVPKPGFDSLYYIFTTGSSFQQFYMKTSAYYSIVNINRNDGRGEVITKNVKLFDYSNERVAATIGADGRSFWIALTQYNTGKIYLYQLTKSGLTSPRITNLPNDKNDYGRGQMKFSNFGTYLAFSNDLGYTTSDHYICLLNFNASNGNLTNPRYINEITSYGLEFSPNEKYLYAQHNNTIIGNTDTLNGIYQFLVDSINNHSLKELIPLRIDTNSLGVAGFQLAPNGYIYISIGPNRFSLSTIEAPNCLGVKCRYKYNSFPLSFGKRSSGLPNLISGQIYQPRVAFDGLCVNDTIKLILKGSATYDSLIWLIDDSIVVRSVSDTSIVVVESAGKHLVNVTVYESCSTYMLYDSLQLKKLPNQAFGKDTLLCTDDTMVIVIKDPLIKEVHWNDGTISKTKVVTKNEQVIATLNDGYCVTSDTLDVAFIDCAFIGEKFCVGDISTFNIASTEIDSIQWNFGDNTQLFSLFSNKASHIYNQPGLYLVKAVIYSNGLSLERSWKIQIGSNPVFSLGNDTTVCETITLTTTLDTNRYLHIWYNSTHNNHVEVSTSGNYMVKVFDGTCSAKDTIALIVEKCNCDLFIPNAISPNLDGLNDQFGVTISEGCEIEEYTLIIFNRWGEVLFSTNDINDRFQLTPDRSYPNNILYYAISLKSRTSSTKQYRGFIQLLN